MKVFDVPPQKCLSEFNEKQLLVEFQDLQDLEWMPNSQEEAECLLWFPNREAFLSNVSQFGSSVHIQGYQCPTMEVEWSDERSERFSYWHVCAKSLALEREIVAHLVILSDSSGFTSLSVTSMIDDEVEGKKDLFPSSPDQIKKIFRCNVDRELHINNFALDEAQSAALVEVDLPLRIKLSSCQFLSRDDNGADLCLFNEALQKRSSPIQSLFFGQNLPFTRNLHPRCQLEAFWNFVTSKNLIDTLSLEELDISKQNGFGDLSSVPLKKLVLRDCTFGLDGSGFDIITEVIRCGCVSEGLEWNGLDSHLGPSRYVLARAVANCQLSEVRLTNVSTKWSMPMMMGVLEMVKRNSKLKDLSVGDVYNFSLDAWRCLMAAVSDHPSLQAFRIDNGLESIPQDIPAAALKLLIDMMKINRNIDVDVALCRCKGKLDEADPIEQLQKFNRFSRQVGKLGQMENLDARLELVGTSAVESRTDFKKLSLLIAGHLDLLLPSFNDVSEEEEEKHPSNKRTRYC